MNSLDDIKERYPNLLSVQELRDRVSIMELALYYGYQPQLRKGRSRPVLTHPEYNDTIIIKNPQDAGRQVYQRAGDFADSGTIIDFIRNRLTGIFSGFNRPAEHEFKNVTGVLYDYLSIDPAQVARKRPVATERKAEKAGQPFAGELFDIRPLEAGNYLLKRHIEPQTIYSPEFAGKVVSQVTYFDTERKCTESYRTVQQHPERSYRTFTNVAFPYYNGLSTEVTGLELRNDNVKLHAPGSDRYSSVFVSNPPEKVSRIYLLESAIDALSHKQLRLSRGDDRFDSVYFSTGGQLTPEQINTITRYIHSFERTADWKIYLAFDNDVKGHLFDLMFIQQLTATKFPLTQTIAANSYIGYILPEEQQYRRMRDKLTKEIGACNKAILTQFAAGSAQQINDLLIAAGHNSGQYIVSIPQATGPLSAFSKSLLKVTGFNERIVMEKSTDKDFNQELIRQKAKF
nr:toprim domain-containing protein [uncultured Arsenicibacter sp.]